VHGVAVPHSDYNAVIQHRCNGGGAGCGDGVGGIVGARDGRTRLHVGGWVGWWVYRGRTLATATTPLPHTLSPATLKSRKNPGA